MTRRVDIVTHTTTRNSNNAFAPAVITISYRNDVKLH